MRRRQTPLLIILVLGAVLGLAPRSLPADRLEPLRYVISFPEPESHFAQVEVRVPTERRAEVKLMMAVWSPGFYRVENYATRVQDLVARTPDGSALQVEQPQKHRWHIRTNRQPAVIISYRLICQGRSVTTNWVGKDLAVLNGPATFITFDETVRRAHEVRLELPPEWKQSMTSLDPKGLAANEYRAPDFDTLADSPIIAGSFTVNEFSVAGSKHYLVDAGEAGQWDSNAAAGDLAKIVAETRRFWGFLPFKKYVFLNVFRQGGGGLEHLNSTLLTSSPRMTKPDVRWLGFVSHEYFHAFNVKRLRPLELGPFDYERPPSTSSLWISEGLTTYFGDLMVVRAGLCSTEEYLSRLSSNIRQLQTAPGRLLQTLEQSSLDVWNSGTSGVGRDPATKVSYYVKGPVVGFLLDARIRRATGGKRSLDDVMRLAYAKYSGARGFTADQFRKTTEDVAGIGMKEWFNRALASTEELDYAEALDWFGLRFAEPGGRQPADAWKLEIRADATEAQREHLGRLLGGSGKKRG